MSLPSFGGCRHPWLVAASLQSLPLSSHGFSIFLCPSSARLLKGHFSLDLGFTQIIQDDLLALRSLITSAKTFFPNKVTFPGTRD